MPPIAHPRTNPRPRSAFQVGKGNPSSFLQGTRRRMHTWQLFGGQSEPLRIQKEPGLVTRLAHKTSAGLYHVSRDYVLATQQYH